MTVKLLTLKDLIIFLVIMSHIAQTFVPYLEGHSVYETFYLVFLRKDGQGLRVDSNQFKGLGTIESITHLLRF